MNQPSYVASLLDEARKAAKNAHAPYSNFKVGAAILLRDDRIVTGCNVENASFGLTICAERTAATRAVVQGDRDWKAIVIVSPTGVTPCGACRQFLSEFAPNLEIWFGYLDKRKLVTGPVSLDALLPGAMKFKP
jgi:cytidine deaminase